jgi:membrane protein YqaA with SNARE-associated domain
LSDDICPTPTRVIAAFRRWTEGRSAPLALLIASFAESTLVPVPIELMMTPMMIARRGRAWLFAGATLIGCLLGVAVMYWVGALFLDAVAQWLAGEGHAARLAQFQGMAETHGPAAVALINITPIPLIVAALGAAGAGMDFLTLMAIVAAFRFARYFGIALIVVALGPRAEAAMDWLMKSRRARRAAIWGGLGLLAVWLAWTLA